MQFRLFVIRTTTVSKEWSLRMDSGVGEVVSFYEQATLFFAGWIHPNYSVFCCQPYKVHLPSFTQTYPITLHGNESTSITTWSLLGQYHWGNDEQKLWRKHIILAHHMLTFLSTDISFIDHFQQTHYKLYHHWKITMAIIWLLHLNNFSEYILVSSYVIQK